MEWRLVVQHEKVQTSVLYRAGRNVVVPYIVLGNNGGHLPLKSIRIGPGVDMELTEKSVKQFLGSKGYDVPVFLSSVPFRI